MSTCTELVNEIIEKFEKHYGNVGQCSDLHKIGKIVATLKGITYCDECENIVKEAMEDKHSKYYDVI